MRKLFTIKALISKIGFAVFFPAMALASGLQFENSYPLPGAQGIAVVGDRAYIASDKSGLTVFDLKSRSIIKTIAVPCWPRDVQVQGNHAYVACYSLVNGVPY